MLPVFTLLFWSSKSHRVGLALPHFGTRPPALPFSQLDSQTDATGLSDHVFFLRDQPWPTETGQTESAIRVNFLESRSWIKKAKPRDGIYSFFLEISDRRVAFNPCPYPTPTTWFQTTRLSMIPRPLPQLSYSMPGCHSHIHTRVHAHIHITHLAGHTTTAWPDSVGPVAGYHSGTAQKSQGWEVGRQGSSECNRRNHPHGSKRGSGARDLDLTSSQGLVGVSEGWNGGG